MTLAVSQSLIHLVGLVVDVLLCEARVRSFMDSSLQFSKRIDMMKHFAKGLDVLKVFNVIQQHPAELQHVLVYNQDEGLTPDMFVGVIKTRRPGDNVKGCAYDWFIEYIHSKGKPQGLFNYRLIHGGGSKLVVRYSGRLVNNWVTILYWRINF